MVPGGATPGGPAFVNAGGAPGSGEIVPAITTGATAGEEVGSEDVEFTVAGLVDPGSFTFFNSSANHLWTDSSVIIWDAKLGSLKTSGRHCFKASLALIRYAAAPYVTSDNLLYSILTWYFLKAVDSIAQCVLAIWLMEPPSIW